MGKRIPMISGDEFDVLTRARRCHGWGAGESSGVKRAYRRRERRESVRATHPDAVESEHGESQGGYLESWEDDDYMGDYPWDVLDPPPPAEPLLVPLREVDG